VTTDSTTGSFDFRSLFYALLIAVALTFVFWLPFWEGGGIIGGDTYSYFFPQKTFFAESLNQGEFPLWNNRTGFGYPAVAESQTGVLYPPNQIWYRLFDPNTAYLANQLLHYVLAFTFTWLFTRTVGLGGLASAFAALVYTYGWFPPRICLEWAIIGGAWLPAALWAVESFLVTRHARWLFWLSLFLALSMLAGHFNLAFMTLLTILAYVPLRLWLANQSLPAATVAVCGRCGMAVLITLALSFALAAAQLAPTWELRGRSQRSAAANTGYGSLPAWYWSQTLLPWQYYRSDVDIDGLLNRDLPPGAPATNKIEAHLYFGLATWGVLLAGLFFAREALFTRQNLLWLILGIGALIYTPGWLLPITRHLPGFSFFMGPGRYGIVVTLAIALIAGSALDGLLSRLKPIAGWALMLGLFALTTADLWNVSRAVTYITMLPNSPLEAVEQSPVAKILSASKTPTRLYAPGANLTNILGTASYPVYLGLGPAEYFDESLPLPAPFSLEAPPDADQVTAAQQAGITHILCGQPLDLQKWPVEPRWSGIDPFLHRAWGRSPQQPLYLYELRNSRGRLDWQSPDADARAEVTGYAGNRIEIAADSPNGGVLVLTDLAYPGWRVSVNGQAAEPVTIDGIYRGVKLPAGKQTVVWNYRPASLYWGAAISLGTLLFWAVVGHVRFWRPQRLNLFADQGHDS